MEADKEKVRFQQEDHIKRAFSGGGRGGEGGGINNQNRVKVKLRLFVIVTFSDQG